MEIDHKEIFRPNGFYTRNDARKARVAKFSLKNTFPTVTVSPGSTRKLPPLPFVNRFALTLKTDRSLSRDVAHAHSLRAAMRV